MEAHLGRELHPADVVHHINGDRLDNRIENLEVMGRAEHSHHHHPLSWDIDEAAALRAGGMTWQAIADRFGLVSGWTIHFAFKTRSLADPLKAASRRTPEKTGG